MRSHRAALVRDLIRRGSGDSSPTSGASAVTRPSNTWPGCACGDPRQRADLQAAGVEFGDSASSLSVQVGHGHDGSPPGPTSVPASKLRATMTPAMGERSVASPGFGVHDEQHWPAPRWPARVACALTRHHSRRLRGAGNRAFSQATGRSTSCPAFSSRRPASTPRGRPRQPPRPHPPASISRRSSVASVYPSVTTAPSCTTL